MSAVSELLIGELAEVPWTVQPEEREEPTTRPMGHQTKSVRTHRRRLNPNTYLRLAFRININNWLRSRINIPRSLLPADLAELL